MQEDHLRKGKDVGVIQSIIAGSVSGIMSRVATAPLDTLKIRLQITPYHTKFNPLVSPYYLSWSNNVMVIIKEMVLKEGIRSFWKGNIPGSIMYVVYGGVQFSSYSIFNRWLSPMNLATHRHGFVVGMMSGMISSFVSYPFDTLRTRFVANKGRKFFNLRDSCRDIWIHEGIKGFYSGCLMSMITFTLSNGIMFSTYETIKVYSEQSKGDENNEKGLKHNILNSSASTISAIISKIITFPIDTVRRRIQLEDSIHLNNFFETDRSLNIYKEYQNLKRERTSKKINRFTFIRIPILMIRYEGIKSLYKGLVIGLCKSIPATVVSLWTYEKVMNLEEIITK